MAKISKHSMIEFGRNIKILEPKACRLGQEIQDCGSGISELHVENQSLGNQRFPMTIENCKAICRGFSSMLGNRFAIYRQVWIFRIERPQISEQNGFGVGSRFSELGKWKLMVGLGKEDEN